MAKLYKGQTLYCKNGETVSVTDFSGDEFSVFYKGKVYLRKMDIIGKKLFLENPRHIKYRNKKRVEIGSRIILMNIDSKEQFPLEIISSYVQRKTKRIGDAYYGTSYIESVGSNANPREGTISDNSPLGKAVIGHVEGDEFTVTLQEGVRKKYLLIRVD